MKSVDVVLAKNKLYNTFWMCYLIIIKQERMMKKW